VEKLDRTKKELLLAALMEKQRREKLKKTPFVPNAGQDKLLRDKAYIRVCTAGNSSGKSVAAVMNAVWCAQGLNPLTNESFRVPNQNIVLLDRPSKVGDKWVPEIKKFFDCSLWKFSKDGTPAVRRITLPNGSEIIFLFQEMSELAFESIDGGGLPGGIASVTVDEPCFHWQFKALIRGGRTKGANTRYLVIGTPLGSNAVWIREDLYERYKGGDPLVSFHSYSSEVNRANLDDGYLEKFSSALSEKEKRIRLHGEWSDLDGLALAHLFDPAVHLLTEDEVDLWDRSNPCVVAIDPHPSKKHFAVLLSVNSKGQLAVLKEIARKEVPREFAQSLKDFMKGYRVIEIVCDNLGSSEMTGGEGFKSFIEVLKECGVKVRPTRYDEKKDDEWITRLQDALVVPTQPNNFGQLLPKLRIAPSCRTLISDIKNVAWMKIKNLDEYRPTLDITNKDALACLKYALAVNLFYDKQHRMKPVYRTGSLYGVTPTGAERMRVKMKLRARYGRGAS